MQGPRGSGLIQRGGAERCSAEEMASPLGEHRRKEQSLCDSHKALEMEVSWSLGHQQTV